MREDENVPHFGCGYIALVDKEEGSKQALDSVKDIMGETVLGNPLSDG